MNTKFYWVLIAVTILLSSCLKQSIADAILNSGKGNKVTATMSYEINGNPVTIKVEDAQQQVSGSRTLVCEKSNIYFLSGISNSGELVLTIFTDSLKLENYQYLGSYGALYVTTFQGTPQYVYGPTDHLTINITTYQNGYISGSFSGRITPAVIPGFPNNVYGDLGSVVITNGIFKNVPVIY